MPFFKRNLANKEALFKNRVFGLNINKYQCKNGVSLIGVGGNLGDSKRLFFKLLIKLKKDALVRVIATAPIYKNPPFGYANQPYFYNTLFLIETKLTPMNLLRYLLHIEKHFGRKRLFANAPRTLDLDILLYNKRKINKGDKLIIPHPHWQSRNSVLVPLYYLKEVECLKRVLSHLHHKRLIN